jgi:hypothetical protein
MTLDEQVEQFKQMPRETQLFTVLVALGNFFGTPVGLSLDENMDRDCTIVMRDKELLMSIKGLIDMATLPTSAPEV